MRKASTALSLLFLLALAGCATVGPDYQAPAPRALGVPDRWNAVLPHGGKLVNLANWWRQFNDTTLSQLIHAAQSSSPTIDQSIARIRQARAQVQVREAGEVPGLFGTATVNRSNTVVPGQATTVLQSALDASWEVDVFGGTRRSSEAAQAELDAATSDWHQARVTLAAEVASTYLSRRQCEALLNIQQASLRSWQETERLTRLRVDAGFSAPSEAAQAEAAVAEVASVLASQSGTCKQITNQLVQLTGLSNNDVERLLANQPERIPVADASVSPLPAVVLSQRPDIAAAERRLAAANAEIGVALADRLPSVSLSGLIGLNVLRMGGRIDAGTTWSFGPALRLPLLDGGRSRAQVEIEQAQYDEALAGYQAQVRQAIREVEDALVRISTISRRQVSAEGAVNANAVALRAAESRYRLGAGNVLILENARRNLLRTREALTAVRAERAQALVALYKAVGGGWQDNALYPNTFRATQGR